MRASSLKLIVVAFTGLIAPAAIYAASDGFDFKGEFYSYFDKSTPGYYPSTSNWYGVNGSSILGISGATDTAANSLSAYSGSNTTFFINQKTPDWAYAATAGSSLGLVLSNSSGISYSNWEISFNSSTNLSLQYSIIDSAALVGMTSYADISSWTTLLTSNTSTYTYDLNSLGLDFALDDGKTVVFNWVNPTGGAYWLDDVNITAVPEPSTYALLLGVGTLGLVGYRRFRRK